MSVKNGTMKKKAYLLGSIKEFRIEPFVRYGAVSNPADETEFMWRLIIVPEDGEKFIYNRQSIDGNWLSQSKALQEKANFHDPSSGCYYIQMVSN